VWPDIGPALVRHIERKQPATLSRCGQTPVCGVPVKAFGIDFFGLRLSDQVFDWQERCLVIPIDKGLFFIYAIDYEDVPCANLR
jgi:hypothetical protein